jgi:hypothetical protein
VNHLLVDGMLSGVWWVERDGRRSATLVVEPARELTAAERAQVESEAHATLAFLDVGAERQDVRFRAQLPPSSR